MGGVGFPVLRRVNNFPGAIRICGCILQKLDTRKQPYFAARGDLI